MGKIALALKKIILLPEEGSSGKLSEEGSSGSFSKEPSFERIICVLPEEQFVLTEEPSSGKLFGRRFFQ